LVINDYTRAKLLFRDTEVAVFKEVSVSLLDGPLILQMINLLFLNFAKVVCYGLFEATIIISFGLAKYYINMQTHAQVSFLKLRLGMSRATCYVQNLYHIMSHVTL